eukprot:923901-Rhodomonas_salina.2
MHCSRCAFHQKEVDTTDSIFPSKEQDNAYWEKKQQVVQARKEEDESRLLRETALAMLEEAKQKEKDAEKRRRSMENELKKGTKGQFAEDEDKEEDEDDDMRSHFLNTKQGNPVDWRELKTWEKHQYFDEHSAENLGKE